MARNVHSIYLIIFKSIVICNISPPSVVKYKRGNMSIQAAEYVEYERLVLDMQTRLLDCAISEIIQEISDVDDIVRRSTEYLRDKGVQIYSEFIRPSN